MLRIHLRGIFHTFCVFGFLAAVKDLLTTYVSSPRAQQALVKWSTLGRKLATIPSFKPFIYHWNRTHALEWRAHRLRYARDHYVAAVKDNPHLTKEERRDWIKFIRQETARRLKEQDHSPYVPTGTEKVDYEIITGVYDRIDPVRLPFEARSVYYSEPAEKLASFDPRYVPPLPPEPSFFEVVWHYAYNALCVLGVCVAVVAVLIAFILFVMYCIAVWQANHGPEAYLNKLNREAASKPKPKPAPSKQVAPKEGKK